MTMEPTQNRSAMRALEVFEAFRTARRPLPLSELAQLTDIPVSTCHGVMRALEQSGYLYFVSGRDAYPTRRLWDLADEIRVNDPIARRLEPALAALRDETDETVILGTRQADRVLYLLVLQSGQAIRYSANAGERKPLPSSAVGKVLLSQMPEDKLDEWLSREPLRRVTDKTIVSKRLLREDLQAARERGYWVTRGENVPDVMAVAAPLRGHGSMLGVAVAGPMHRMQSKEPAIARRLLNCVRRLELHNEA